MADIKGKSCYPFITPVRRTVRFKMAFAFLTDILQGIIGGVYKTSLPEDAQVVEVCPALYDDIPDGFWVIVASESYEVVPPGQPIPVIPPVVLVPGPEV